MKTTQNNKIKQYWETIGKKHFHTSTYIDGSRLTDYTDIASSSSTAYFQDLFIFDREQLAVISAIKDENGNYILSTTDGFLTIYGRITLFV